MECEMAAEDSWLMFRSYVALLSVVVKGTISAPVDDKCESPPEHIEELQHGLRDSLRIYPRMATYAQCVFNRCPSCATGLMALQGEILDAILERAALNKKTRAVLYLVCRRFYAWRFYKSRQERVVDVTPENCLLIPYLSHVTDMSVLTPDAPCTCKYVDTAVAGALHQLDSLQALAISGFMPETFTSVRETVDLRHLEVTAIWPDGLDNFQCGMAELGDSLAHLPSLQSLTLNCSMECVNEHHTLRLFANLSSLQALTRFSLTNFEPAVPDFPSEAAYELGASLGLLPALWHLELKHMACLFPVQELVWQKILHSISISSHLETLVLWEVTICAGTMWLGDELSAVLLTLRNLKKLRLDLAQIELEDENGVRLVPPNHVFSNTLGQLTSLTYLEIRDSGLITVHQCYPQLGKLVNLKDLHLMMLQNSEDDDIPERLPPLSEVLLPLTALTSLTLKGLGIPQGCDTCPCSLVSVPIALPAMPHLHKLDITENNLKLFDLALLAECVARHTSINKVRASNGNMRDHPNWNKVIRELNRLAGRKVFS